VQKGLIGCTLFVTTHIVAFVLLRFVISVSVVIPALHRTFSVLLTAKAPSANQIPTLLWFGSNLFSTASVADPHMLLLCTSVYGGISFGLLLIGGFLM
jgi:hypothetical protein